MSNIRRSTCPICHTTNAVVSAAFMSSRGSRTISIVVCSCDPSVVNARLHPKLRTADPHPSLVTAARRVASGEALNLEGSDTPCSTLEALFETWGDLTTARNLRQSGAETAEAPQAASPSDAEGHDEEPESAEAVPSDLRGPVFEAARQYVERGYSVVLLHGVAGDSCACFKAAECPCPGKHPVGADWQKRAVRTVEELEKRWDARRGLPTNIGILVSHEQRVLDVDVDVKKGKRGLESLAAWEKRLEISLDPYLTQVTPSGGRHYVFRVPADVDPGTLPNRSEVAPGIDVLRNERQFVVSPSAVLGGRQYFGPNGEASVVLPPINELPEVPRPLIALLQSLGGDRTATREAVEDVESLKAPSVEKVREVVACIPNGPDVDRGKYIWMAYRILAACGRGNEAEAEDIFLGWASGYPNANPAEDKRVFDSLDWDKVEGGWDDLWHLASRNGYDASAERLLEAQEAFGPTTDSVDDGEQGPAADGPSVEDGEQAGSGDSPIARLLAGTNLLTLHAVSWDKVPTMLSAVRMAMRALRPDEQAIVQTIAFAQLQKKTRSWQRALDMVRQFLPLERGSSPFTYDDEGLPRLKARDLRSLNLRTPYIVPGLIPAAAVGAVIADYSLGKTWLMVDLGLSVAFGQAWFGRPTQARPVVFAIAEGTHSFPKRLMGWLVAHHQLPTQVTPEHLHTVLNDRAIISEYPVRFDDPDVEAGLIRTIESAGAALLIIDTLGKSLGAEQSEDKNDTANAVTGMLSRIAAATGCAVVFTHHTGYGDRSRGRGASAWTQGLDFAYIIDGSANDLMGGRSLRLKTIKMRDDQWPPVLPFRLKVLEEPIALSQGGEAQSVTSAVIEPVTDVDFPAVDVTTDLTLYTTRIGRGDNTHALHLALAVMGSVDSANRAASGHGPVTRKEFVGAYNARLDAEATKTGVASSKLADGPAKILLGQLRDHLPPLIRREGKGRAASYILTEDGRRLAASTFADFDAWWKTPSLLLGSAAQAAVASPSEVGAA